MNSFPSLWGKLNVLVTVIVELVELVTIADCVVVVEDGRYSFLYSSLDPISNSYTLSFTLVISVMSNDAPGILLVISLDCTNSINETLSRSFTVLYSCSNSHLIIFFS